MGVAPRRASVLSDSQQDRSDLTFTAFPSSSRHPEDRTYLHNILGLRATSHQSPFWNHVFLLTGVKKKMALLAAVRRWGQRWSLQFAPHVPSHYHVFFDLEWCENGRGEWRAAFLMPPADMMNYFLWHKRVTRSWPFVFGQWWCLLFKCFLQQTHAAYCKSQLFKEKKFFTQFDKWTSFCFYYRLINWPNQRWSGPQRGTLLHGHNSDKKVYSLLTCPDNKTRSHAIFCDHKYISQSDFRTEDIHVIHPVSHGFIVTWQT